MFKNRIREKRQELGISQVKLSSTIGLANCALSNFELGKWRVWPKARRELSQALNTPESELFEDNE